MNLNPKKLGLAGGIVWGAAMLFTTWLSLLWSGYGDGLLNLMASVYPGYDISFVGSIIGLVYGFVDAFVGLYIFGWLYNKLK